MRATGKPQPNTTTRPLFGSASDLAPMCQERNTRGIDPTLCQRIPANPAQAHDMAIAYLTAAIAALHPDTYAALAAPPHMHYRIWLAAQRARQAAAILETLLSPR